eukprot:Skav219326  [mRNA]  locus=scaffold1957:374901:375113:- [translate_table: standard]
MRVGCLDLGNRDGDTALHYAAAWGRTDVARMLMEAGASLSVRNHQGHRPIDDAVSFGHADLSQVMAGYEL